MVGAGTTSTNPAPGAGESDFARVTRVRRRDGLRRLDREDDEPVALAFGGDSGHVALGTWGDGHAGSELRAVRRLELQAGRQGLRGERAGSMPGRDCFDLVVRAESAL